MCVCERENKREKERERENVHMYVCELMEGSNIWRQKELGRNPEADADVQIFKANDE